MLDYLNELYDFMQHWKLMKLVLSMRGSVTLIRMKLHYEANPPPPLSLYLTHTHYTTLYYIQ